KLAASLPELGHPLLKRSTVLPLRFKPTHQVRVLIFQLRNPLFRGCLNCSKLTILVFETRCVGLRRSSSCVELEGCQLKRRQLPLKIAEFLFMVSRCFLECLPLILDDSQGTPCVDGPLFRRGV